jgi:hypothetical protein
MPTRLQVEGNAAEQAAVLASRIQRGADEAVAALATALDLAGFPIRNSDGTMIAPSAPSQGIAFNAWEVNTLANLVARRRTLSAPLASVASALASPLPGLTGEAMTGFILDAVRRPAYTTEGPLVFWSAFIIELGRRARTHAQFDLLGEIDPAAAHLDIVQIAFITKRLAADVAAFAHPERAQAPTAAPRFALHVPAWLVQPLAAQPSPCQFTDTETEIFDWTAIVTTNAFGALTGWLGTRGVAGAAGAGAAAAYTGVVLAYLKLALTQWAFEIEFELEDAPLVRTTQVRPQQGEDRTLVTTVSMDFGKVSWINCYRIMLNAIGLDLNVDNDGPYKGAEVTWTGWAGFRAAWAIGAGPEHLVMLSADSEGRIQGGGPVGNMNQITDDNGEARVTVTGRGQDEFLGSQPRELMKAATVSAMVVLKPADLYRDFKDAGQTAIGGLPGVLTIPVELLFRTRWSFGGTYTFPIKDWRAGNGWTGTVSYRLIQRSVSENKSTGRCCGGRPTASEYRQEREEVREANWELPAHTGTDPVTADFSTGMGKMTLTVTRKTRFRRFSTAYASCRGGSRPQTSTTSEQSVDANADFSGAALVSVHLSDSGEFRITAGGPDHGEAMGESHFTYRTIFNDGCTGVNPPKGRNETRPWRGRELIAHINGTVDPDAAELRGSQTKVVKSKDGTHIETHIYEWNLRR